MNSPLIFFLPLRLRNDVIAESKAVEDEFESVLERQIAFGYTQEDLRMILSPIMETGTEPTGSMGNDTPLAVLSDKPQLVFNYFKQLFAQVTNPPLDGIREEIITDTSLTIGNDVNIFEICPEQCKKMFIKKTQIF